MKTSFYRHTRDKIGNIKPLDEVVNVIQSGSNGLKEKTEKARILAIGADKDAYKKFKESALPAFTPAGTFNRRKTEHLDTHSGLVVIDIDGLSPESVYTKKANFEKLPFVILVFVSPSGTGIKVIVKVDPIPTDAASHREAWQQIVNYFQPMGLEIDPSGKDLPRLCLLAHDPTAYYNPNATAFTLKPSEPIPAKPTPPAFTSEKDQSDDISSALYAVPADDYEIWIEMGMALHHAEEIDDAAAFRLWSDWSATSTKFNPNEDLEAKWRSFASGTGKGLGSVFHLAKQNGWIPPNRNLPKSTPTVDKDKATQSIQKRVRNRWKHGHTPSQIISAVKQMREAAQFTEAEINALIDKELPKLNIQRALDVFHGDYPEPRQIVPGAYQ